MPAMKPNSSSRHWSSRATPDVSRALGLSICIQNNNPGPSAGGLRGLSPGAVLYNRKRLLDSMVVMTNLD